MRIGVLAQGYGFLACTFAGIALGILRDILWAMGKDKKFLKWVADLLTGLCLLIINLVLFLYIGDGEYGIFFPVGVLFGFLLWRWEASKGFRHICIVVWTWIFFPFAKIWGFLKKIIKKMKKILKNPFSNRKKSVKIKGQQSANGGESCV